MDEIHVTDPNAEVIALSPTTLMATNRFVCEICNKGFQRNQNLQLHRRGRNPPWKLRQRGSNELMKKRVYVCPEPSCVHHNPARALGDSTGIKKITADNMVKRNGSVTNALEDMLSNLTGRPTRKHVALGNTNVIGEPYFPRRDSFITHRAFCDTLTEENNRQIELPDLIATTVPLSTSSNNTTVSEFNNNYDPKNPLQEHIVPLPFKSTSARQHHCFQSLPRLQNNASASSAHMSATALLQKAAQMGATASNNNNNNSIIINSPTMMQKNFVISGMAGPHHNHNSSSYDHFHHPNPDQSHMQFFHKGQQEMSLIFDSNNNDMRMFGTMFMGIK
uniref:C2H2-type domain-containing protein n=2 Tax=Glycine subgen. Soja TaxID=1462606 RepID=A0A0R0HTD1_SOYBN